MRSLKIILALGFFAVLATASTPYGKAADSDSAYMTAALSAAPPAVASGAAVIRMEKDGSMTTLRPGTNGFSCFLMGPLKGSPSACLDANSMEFIGAWMKHAPPPNKLGVGYMLMGDAPGTSNTDPYATAKTADNHWVTTGPHIMIFGPSAKLMGLPATKDPDPTKPYMMWAGTPYEHAMIPVAASK
jgi:hypothetical protein